MLLAGFPLTDVLAPIIPGKGAHSLSFVVYEFTIVFLTVNPNQKAMAIHLIVAPVSLICLPIRPEILAKPAYFILSKLSLVVTRICKRQKPIPFFLGFDILTLILGSVRPALFSIAVLLIILPVSNVRSPVDMFVSAFAIRLIIKPSPHVDIAVGMDEAAEPKCLAVFYPSLIIGSIFPCNISLPLLNI